VVATRKDMAGGFEELVKKEHPKGDRKGQIGKEEQKLRWKNIEIVCY
jgi:hypothetical protein